jgi:hypothetical protein
MEVGFFNQDTLRGKIGDSGAFHGLTHSGFGDPNELIFRRMRGRNGFAISSKPIDNLWVGFNVQALGNRDYAHDVRTGGNANGTYTNAGSVYSQFQLAAGYTIPNIGVVRVQFLGADKDTHQNVFSGASAPGTPHKNRIQGGISGTQFVGIPQGHLIQTAFNLTAVQGLNLDFGFGIPLVYTVGARNDAFYNVSQAPDTVGIDALGNIVVIPGNVSSTVNGRYRDVAGGDSTTYQAPLNLSLGAEYKTGDLGVWFRTDFFFGGYIQQDDEKQYYPVAWDFHVKPYYKIGDIGTVGLDFGFDAYGNVNMLKDKVAVNDSGEDKTLKGGIHTVGFGLWLQKSIGGGTLTTGLAYKVINKVDSFYGRYRTDPANNEYAGLRSSEMKELGVFSIPVVFELSF